MKALILKSTKAVKKVIPPRIKIPEFIADYTRLEFVS
jgi:hypothetical protein